MSPAQYLRTGSLGILFGIALALFSPSLWSIDPLLTALVGAGLFLFLFFTTNPWVIRGCIVVACALLAMTRLLALLPHDIPERLEGEGIVQAVAAPQYGGHDTTVRMDTGTHVLVRDVKTRFRYGDRVRVTCTPELVDVGDVRQALRMAARDIWFTCERGRVTLLAHDAGNPLFHLLYRTRNNAASTLRSLLHEPEASIATGMLLGIDASLPDDLTQMFRRTGLIHILVVSGSHMVFLMTAVQTILLLFQFYPRTRGLASIVILFLFVAMIGFPASAVRGFLFATLTVIARLVGRQRAITTALLGVAALMVLENPFILRDLGFQLSFLATVGVSLVAKKVDSWIDAWVGLWRSWRGIPVIRATEPKGIQRFFIHWFGPAIRNLVCETFGAIIMTAPLIATTLGQLSLVSPLANILLVPFAQPIMILGGVTILLSPLMPLGFVAAAMLHATIVIFERLADLFASFPYAQIILPRSWLVSLVAYLCIILWMYGFPRFARRS